MWFSKGTSCFVQNTSGLFTCSDSQSILHNRSEHRIWSTDRHAEVVQYNTAFGDYKFPSRLKNFIECASRNYSEEYAHVSRYTAATVALTEKSLRLNSSHLSQITLWYVTAIRQMSLSVPSYSSVAHQLCACTDFSSIHNNEYVFC